MTLEESKIEIQDIIDIYEKEDMYPLLKDRQISALKVAISALQAQEAKAQLSAEGTTSDLISRQDAIEVIEEMQMPIMRSMFPEEQFVFKGMSEALSAIKDLPSAQPEIEERKEESAQNVPKEDLISRKAAIDAIVDCTVYGNADELEEAVMQGNDWNRWSGGVLEALEAVKELPSVTPKCPECDDAVSREATIDVAENAFVRGLLASPDIRKLLSVQPERKKGEWTKDCACEICGFKPWYERDIHTLSFCPNCGADMRGDDHDL